MTANHISSYFAPDKIQAAKHLQLLDKTAESFCFQTFDDLKVAGKKKRPHLAAVLNGTLDQHWEKLCQYSAEGAGIFVTVNQTDGAGRKKANIQSIRAVWQEADDPEVPEPPLDAHITIESSPGKFHRYMRVEPVPITKESISEFDDVMLCMVLKYGSDPNAKDLSRVLRLAGFPHQKDPANPWPVRIVKESLHPPYTWGTVKQALPRTEKPNGKAVPTQVKCVNDTWADIPTNAQARDLRSALASISSDDRELWIKLGHALKTAGEQGWSLFNEWSQTSDKYDPADTARVWKSLHPTATHWRNVFAWAQDAGWINPTVKNTALVAGQNTMFAASPIGEVRDEKFIRIAEVHSALFSIKGASISPEHVAIVQGVMACCDEGSELLANWEIANDIAKASSQPPQRELVELFKLASQSYGWKSDLPLDPEGIRRIDEQRKRSLHAANSLWAIANIEGKAVFVEKVESQGFGRNELRLSSPDTAARVFKPLQVPTVVVNRGVTSVQWKGTYKIWEESQNRHTYQNFRFKPLAGVINNHSCDLLEGPVLELFMGLSIEPRAGECSLILSHIKDIWCSSDETAFAYVMCWLARMFQNPQERGHTAIVLKSGEGTGKNIIIDFLTAAWGRHGITISDSSQVVGKFNDHLSTSVLVFLNEALWGGDRSHEGALKRLVSDITLEVERKFIPRFEVQNCTHLLISSNNDWAVPVGIDDRRILILDVNESKKGNFAYFKKLDMEIKDGGDAAFIHMLLNWDIASFNPRDIPRGLACASKTYLDQKMRTANSIIKWWLHCLDIGCIYTFDDSYKSGSPLIPQNWDEDGETIDKAAAYGGYAKFCRQNVFRVESISAWTQMLKKFGVVIGDNVKFSDRSRTRGIRVEPLGKMRALAEKMMGSSFSE